MKTGLNFFIGIPHPHLDEPTKCLLKKIQPGGVILFGRNVQSPPQLAELNREIRKILGRKVMICLDHEGGRVNRLKEITGVVPSAPQLAYLKDPKWAFRHGTLTGRLLRELGVNTNLAPVLDLWLRPKTDNSVPDRCWSKNPAEVALYAGAFLHGMQKEGVVGCGKHFLGYGAADKDPHLLLPRVNRTQQQILRDDLFPYAKLTSGRTGSAKSLSMIMLSHAHLRAFHGTKLTPACISPEVNQGLLRKKLKFSGVSITDDLEMGAIIRTMPIGEAAVRCLQASVDFLLICHTAKAIEEAFHAVEQAVQEGVVTRQILSASQKRIQKLRKQPPTHPKFSHKRFSAILEEIRDFTREVFSQLPPTLRVIDERWGPIGEK